MKKIAMCVLTYNHAEVVDKVLNFCVQDYYELGIDIYYYDGSEGDDTKNVIEKYIAKGYDNIYYIRESGGVPKRFEMICKGEQLVHEYKYIWISKDRSFCIKPSLEKIVDATDSDSDVIFLGTIKAEGLCDKEYDDHVSFYGDWGWLATSMDTAIYKQESMLMDYYDGKYENIFGLHYQLLFCKLAELENIKIRVLYDDIRISGLPEIKSVWHDQIFTIWKDDWIRVNELLPACYDPYKKIVIKCGATLPWLLGGIDRLIELHDEGILVPERLGEIEQNWEMVSDVPFSKVVEIANGTYDKKHDLTQISDINSQCFELISQVLDLMKNGAMSNEQVPHEDMAKLLLGDADVIYGADLLKVRNLAFGSIEDLAILFNKYELTIAEKQNLIQAMLLLTYLPILKK